MTNNPASKPVAYINARLIDGETELDTVGQLLTVAGKIEALGQDIELPNDCEIIDCGGRILAPGFIDMRSQQLDTDAALAGGFTSVAIPPNDKATLDTASAFQAASKKGETEPLDIHPLSSATTKGAGEVMVELSGMTALGATTFTDGHTISNANIMRQLLATAKQHDALIIQFAEEVSLADGGMAHEGDIASRLGLAAIPTLAETIQIDRDCQLAAATGARLHFALISSREGAERIRKAKQQGIKVSAATAPHYLYQNHIALEGYRTAAKLSPPLRDETDRLALLEAVKDGTIDTIVSDHAPHSDHAKDLPFADAPFGVSSQETLLPLMLSQVHAGHFDLMTLIKSLTITPAKHLGLPSGRLQIGAPADLVIFDPRKPWVIDRSKLKSAGKNIIQEKILASGQVWRTICGGVTRYWNQS